MLVTVLQVVGICVGVWLAGALGVSAFLWFADPERPRKGEG